jgi:hypothetical protein
MNIKTLYGEVTKDQYDEYCRILLGKIFKILPMKEEKNPTLKKYIDSLLVELDGGKSMIENFGLSAEYISIINSIKGLQQVEDTEIVRSKVFECISLARKII